jgi:hypothetical protein
MAQEESFYAKEQHRQGEQERKRKMMKSLIGSGDAARFKEQQRKVLHERELEEQRGVIYRKEAKEKEAKERQREAANQAVLDDLQKTGGPRDVLAVIPDKKSKQKQGEPKEMQKKAEQSWTDAFGPSPKPASRQEKRKLLQLDRAAPGPAKRGRPDGPGSVPDYMQHQQQQSRREVPSLEILQAKQEEAQMIEGMKQRHKAQYRAKQQAASGARALMLLKQVEQEAQSDQPASGPGLAQQTNNPNRTETVNTQPDVMGQDPAMGKVAPVGTGQEAQNTSAQVNTSAADQDLIRLQEQLAGSGGAAEMGTQNVAGQDVGYDMPRPTGDKPTMFGGDGGIGAVEEQREQTKDPTPEVAEATLMQQKADKSWSEAFEQPSAPRATDSERARDLLKVPLVQKSDAQVEQESQLMSRAEQFQAKHKASDNPLVLQQKREVAKLLRSEDFEAACYGSHLSMLGRRLPPRAPNRNNNNNRHRCPPFTKQG